jgi:hypothetical protein
MELDFIRIGKKCLENMQIKIFWKDSSKSKLKQNKNKQTPWPKPTSELYRPSDRSLSEKVVPTSTDRGRHVVSVMDPYSHAT